MKSIESEPLGPQRNYIGLVLSCLIRLLPSRAGFAERDASRPAFGGSSLLYRNQAHAQGVAPMDPACPSVHKAKKRARLKPRKLLGYAKKEKKTGDFGPRPEDFTHCARREQKGNPRWISIQTDRSLQMTNTPFCLFPQGHPLAKLSQASTPRDAGGCRSCQGATPGSSAWISSGTAPEREARTNDCVPFVQYPTYDRSHHQSQSSHSIVGTTRRQRMRCLSSLVWPLLL